jgi:hypothetical protein
MQLIKTTNVNLIERQKTQMGTINEEREESDSNSSSSSSSDDGSEENRIAELL